MKSSSRNFIPLTFNSLSPQESYEEIQAYWHKISQRRSVRHFSDAPVDRQIIEKIIRIAASAPSGAHKQPWTFCVVSDEDTKRKIRDAAEKEEYENYHGRMSEEWLEDLAPFGTDWNKDFLTTAPWIIVIFKKAYDLDPNGKKLKNYYVNESVGIAAGFLLTAIHAAGLVTLTHTPSPMGFLQKLLDRPDNERPFLLIPVGYPAEDAMVPDIHHKSLEEISFWYT